MGIDPRAAVERLTGHALRNAHLRQRALERAQSAPPLAGTIVKIRAEVLGMTRLEFARRSGISRGTLRDLELGIHTPTRRILQRFVTFCEQNAVAAPHLETLQQHYAGVGDTIGELIARLELRAGSPRELARRVGISPTTLWEYRRGNFPLPLALLRQLCQAVDDDPAPAEALWFKTERQRLLDRGYPDALAEFWALCARAGHAERHLLALGLPTPTVRRLRYLELPAWEEVQRVARLLCRDESELTSLKRLWQVGHQGSNGRPRDAFGPRIRQLRSQRGISRRQLADLFGIGGKKPARIIKYIEEDGFYSTQAYPAGLVALLVPSPAERDEILALWRARRTLFHRRHRPEMRIDLRLARELYGLEPRAMEAILGYSNLEYQRIERGVSPLLDSARERIVQAIHAAGEVRIQALLRKRQQNEEAGRAWEAPQTLGALVTLLAQREGGFIPLMRRLKQAGLKGLWIGRLRAIARGSEVPAWPILEKIAEACGVLDLTEVKRDWRERFRARLEASCPSPLGVDLRLLIAEAVPTLRALSPRLGFNYSVLIRDLQRIDRDEPIRWYHIERILRCLGVAADSDEWRGIHALWYTSAERCRKPLIPSRSAAAIPSPAGKTPSARRSALP
jgi:transcriptional regulator with XRE-family HTH domain